MTLETTTDLFDRLRTIPMYTRKVNPAEFDPCIRPLIRALSEHPRTVHGVLWIMQRYDPGFHVNPDMYMEAQVALLTVLLLHNEGQLLKALHVQDKGPALGEVLCGDSVWEKTLAGYAPPEIVAGNEQTEPTDPEVNYDAAQSVAVILLAIKLPE